MRQRAPREFVEHPRFDVGRRALSRDARHERPAGIALAAKEAQRHRLPLRADHRHVVGHAVDRAICRVTFTVHPSPLLSRLPVRAAVASARVRCRR
ncbi:hypothetical protein BURCENBC7_AP0011 [Burkholderia cenocepacia BC7]|nr:hypothetical protein BURCENBC7_AP0011 [Burkholderia cenocepacia BC7]